MFSLNKDLERGKNLPHFVRFAAEDLIESFDEEEKPQIVTAN